ncbi:hypothetical protein KM043_013694 [Ampulex compressa]|nr:hypothetical protein KM043_013694 [Ampulex compressa]
MRVFTELSIYIRDYYSCRLRSYISIQTTIELDCGLRVSDSSSRRHVDVIAGVNTVAAVKLREMILVHGVIDMADSTNYAYVPKATMAGLTVRTLCTNGQGNGIRGSVCRRPWQ